MSSRLGGRTTQADAPAKASGAPTRAPAAASKELAGRFGLQRDATRVEIGRAVRAAIREQLIGRVHAGMPPQAGAAQPARKHGLSQIEAEAYEGLLIYDDDDLFTILSKAPAVLDRIKPSAPVKDAGPAIGVAAR